MQRVNLLEQLKHNPFVLAPMAGITDYAFRSYMKDLGCGIVITELVSATGLLYNSEKTRNIMRFSEEQRPVGVQLFGENLDALASACKEVEAMGADFVDLNFGCPVPKVVKKGAGAALLKDLSAVKTVFQAAKAATSLPVTVKVRTGWDESSKNTIELAHIAYEEGISWVAIHGRTRAQAYTGLADWDYIAEVKAKSKIAILGNGDIASGAQAVGRLDETGCDGVMIGRGCLKNPWIFKQAMDIYEKRGAAEESHDFSIALERLSHHLDSKCDERIAQLQLKKLAAWYSAGYPGSSQFRKRVFQIKQSDELKDSVQEFFATQSMSLQKDTSHEPFLMGGHG